MDNIVKIILETTDIKTVTDHYRNLTIGNFALEITSWSFGHSGYSSDTGVSASDSLSVDLNYDIINGIISTIGGTQNKRCGVATSACVLACTYRVVLYINSTLLKK